VLLWCERMVVAMRANRLVGCAAVKGKVLRALYVDPWHGRGSGTSLLCAAEWLARRSGTLRP
jgi:N-acetylglutamate synthase-like GNAT family acetyltransferase